jgi:hypothetical protein
MMMIKNVGMWLYVNLFRLCVCVGGGGVTYLVEIMSWNLLNQLKLMFGTYL